MTTCDRVREDLVAWIDEELEGPAVAAVVEHLAGCAVCSAEAERLRAVDRALDLLGADEVMPRAGWVGQMQSRIVPARTAGSRRHPGLGRWLAAAALLLASCGLFMWATPDRPRDLAEQLEGQRPAPRPEDPRELPAQPTPDPELESEQELVDEIINELERRELEREGREPGLREPLPPSTPPPPRPRVEQQPRVQPEGPPIAGLTPEEQQLVEELELLAFLAESEELDLLGSLELLQELAPEELDDA